MAGHGLTPSERAVMDLWDEGMTIASIALQLGKDAKAVKRVVGIYSIGRDPGMGASSSFDRMSRQGTEDLLAAIRRHHPEIFAERAA